MSTSPRKKIKPRRGFVPRTALAQSVEFDAHMMRVTLMDGRELGVPLAWFPTLKKAIAAQRIRCEIGGVGLRWPDFDEDLRLPVSWQVPTLSRCERQPPEGRTGNQRRRVH